MPSYLFTAVDAQKQRLTDRIEAGDLATARLLLTRRGYTGIVFHQDDLNADLKRYHNPNPDPDVVLSPQRQLEIQYRLGNRNLIIESLRLMKKTLPLIAILCAMGLLSWPANKFYLGFGLLLAPIFFVIGILLKLPGYYYDRILHACVWQRWDEMRSYIARMRKLKNWIPKKILGLEMEKRLAYADAAEGRLDQGLARMAQYQNDRETPKWMYYSNLSNVYSYAKNYDEVVRYRAAALECNPGGVAMIIDYAMALALYKRDPAATRAILAQAEGQELTDQAGVFYSLCKGIILVEEENYAEAMFQLSEAARKVAPYHANVMMISVRSLMNAYRAIAAAKTNERAEAKNYFAEAEPYLRANALAELLQRCQNSIQ
jgi:hypothetical protein